eukprot:gene24381-29476_t
MVWARSAGLAGIDQGWSVAMDPSGSFVSITGGVSGAIHGESFSGDVDLFVMKFTTDGTRQWTRLVGTSGRDEGFGVAIDNTGSIYSAGTASGTLHSQSSAGGREVLLIKYDFQGNRLWTRLTGTSSNDEARAIALDSTGMVYVTGYTTGGLNGNSFQGVWDMFLVNAGDIFVSGTYNNFVSLPLIKYAADGTRSFLSLLGASGTQEGYGIVARNSDVYIAGFTIGPNDFGVPNAGNDDIILMRASGSRQPTGQPTGQPSGQPTMRPTSFGGMTWTRMAGGIEEDSARGIAVDNSGSVYVTGFVSGSIHGQSFAGAWDLVLTKYSSGGSREWTRLVGGGGNDAVLCTARPMQVG